MSETAHMVRFGLSQSGLPPYKRIAATATDRSEAVTTNRYPSSIILFIIFMPRGIVGVLERMNIRRSRTKAVPAK